MATRQPATYRYATLERRTIALERYDQQASRAHDLGEGSRVIDHLSALSAAEIENATWTLARTLDRLVAERANAATNINDNTGNIWS